MKAVDYELMTHVNDGSDMRNIWKYVILRQDELLRNATSKKAKQKSQEGHLKDILFAVTLLAIIFFGSCIDGVLDILLNMMFSL